MEANFGGICGVAVNSAGDVIVAEPGLIRKISGGVVTTIAGSQNQPLYGHRDGVGRDSLFQSSLYLAVGPDDHIFVADTDNHRIRKIAPDGAVTTHAGSGEAGIADGQGIAATFNFQDGLALDGDGNIFVGDSGNHRVRKISPNGDVTTFAGGTRGFEDGQGADACFDNPRSVALDRDGNVLVADCNNYRIRKITPSGMVTTLAGSGEQEEITDGQGVHAVFASLEDIAVDGDGNLFVAEGDYEYLRKVTPDGVVTTIYCDCNMLWALAVDGKGNLIVASMFLIYSTALGVAPPTFSRPALVSKHVANLASLLDDARFADVEFHVDGETTTAHRAVLVAQCEYFETMFTGNFVESQPGSSGKVVCRVEDTTMPALKFLLRFLYTGSLDDPADEDAVQVMRLADRYGVERLLAHCLDVRRITHANAVPWLIQSDEHNLDTLRKNTKRHVVRNFGEIRKAKRQKFDLLSEHPKLLMEVVHEIKPDRLSTRLMRFPECPPPPAPC
jgi:hypothetical protein